MVNHGGLNFVVVGRGPTGVELCGALVELFNNDLFRDFHGDHVPLARVLLVEALPMLLRGFHEVSKEYAQRTLEERGVEVRLNAKITKVTERGVELADGSRINAGTVIWAAGARRGGRRDPAERA